jgi:hypothetical protein
MKDPDVGILVRRRIEESAAHQVVPSRLEHQPRPYPVKAGEEILPALAFALLDGPVAAFDDTTFDQLWKISAGSGFSAPAMTFEVCRDRLGTEPGRETEAC